jgi:lysozyme
MRISDNGLELIKSFEGLYLKAYLCPAKVWTIGYGHTGNVKPGDVINRQQADELLRQDVEEFVAIVNTAVKVPLTQNQFDSLVSFVYNVGADAFRKSTLLRKLNAGDYAGAAQEFERWNKAHGVVLPGLVKRRKKERELFERPSQ